VYGSLVGHQGGITTASFSRDGGLVATASLDGTARVWDATPGGPVVALRAGAEMVTSVAFAPDGCRLVTAGDWGPVRTWDAATGAPIARFEMNACLARFSATGEVLLAAGSPSDEGGPEVRRLDPATGTEMPAGALGDLPHEIVCSPDGRLLAAVREEAEQLPTLQWVTTAAELLVAEIDSGAVVTRIPLDVEEDGGWAILCFGSDGRLLVTRSTERKLLVWELATARPTAALQIDPDAACLTPDGSTLVGALDTDLGIWRLSDGAELARLRGHAILIVSMDVTPDGRLAATASLDGTARVWDIAARKALYTLEPRVGPLNLARISPDGTRLLTVTPDGDAHLWDLATGDLVVHYAKPEGRNASVGWYTPPEGLGDFSPDGRRVVTASWDGLVRIRPADPLAAALAAGPRALTPEERAEFLEPLDEGYAVRRAARRRVEALFHELILKEDVLSRLRSEPGLAPDVREVALGIAGGRETDRSAAEMVAWSIVEDPRRSEAERRWAVRLARALLRDAEGPEASDGNVLLAAALCRAGEDREAAVALARADDGTLATGQALAIRALLHARAGRTAEASADLERAREAPYLDTAGRAFAEEAASLLAPK
jgi:WD40 repeat protein